MSDTDTVEALLRRLRQSGETERLSHDAMVAVRANLDARAAWAYTIERTGSLRLVGACGLDEELEVSVSTLGVAGSEAAARCAVTKTDQLHDAASATATSDRTILDRTGAKRLHAVPLTAHDDLTGVLAFTTVGEPRASDERIEAVATILALTLGGMMARRSASSANEQLARTTQSTQELADYLGRVPHALVQTVAALPEDGPGFDVREFFTLVAERARNLVDAELAAVGVGSSPDHSFQPWVFVGMPPDVEKAIGRHPRPVGTLGVVAIEGETLRVRDVHEHPAFVGWPPQHPDIRSLLAVPLRFRGESFGNLYLGNKRGAAEFDAADQRMIEMLAALAASGVRLSMLLATIERDRTSLRHILEAEPDGVCFVDAKAGHLLANRAFNEILGEPIEREAGIEQKLGVIRRPDGRPLTLEELPSTRALKGESTPGAELLVVRRDGRKIPVSERAAPVRSADGTMLGAVVTLRDITLAKEMDRLREEFAAMVAHDLRNPIQSMLVQIQMLRKAAEEGKPTPSAALDRLSRCGTRLAQMAGDLLDSTRIELSRVPLERMPLDVVDAVHGLVERIGPTLGAHEVVVESEGDIPTASLDPTRFDQILTNLIENAAKYSPEGTAVQVRVEPADKGFAVSVRDQGFGIDPKEIPRLFDRFYQAKRARERRTGLGLGLYITKGFVEAHGGKISVESAIGRGSTFRVWLPSAPPPIVERSSTAPL